MSSLFSEVSLTDSFYQLCHGEGLAVLVLLGVFVTVLIISIVSQVLRHQERMAMIERGLHPDHPPKEKETVKVEEPEEKKTEQP